MKEGNNKQRDDGNRGSECLGEKRIHKVDNPKYTGITTPNKIDLLPHNQRLGIIFDIDGTLIAEGRHIHTIIIRPGTIPFLHWCKRRGHSIALWTKAHSSWANNVAMKLRKSVALYQKEQSFSGADFNVAELFDFIWSSDKLTRQNYPSIKSIYNSYIDTGIECKWCEVYSSRCGQCTCHYNYTCPCREIKDMRKVWYSQSTETRNFTKERTLMVENTPQNCIYNYGNAIYVPTYSGYLNRENVFERFQLYLERDIECCENVRAVKKCNHSSTYHACYEQSWLLDDGDDGGGG